MTYNFNSKPKKISSRKTAELQDEPKHENKLRRT